MIIRDDYTLQITNNVATITFGSAVVFERIHRIVNLTQKEVIYNTETNDLKTQASLEGGVLTFGIKPKNLRLSDVLSVEYLNDITFSHTTSIIEEVNITGKYKNKTAKIIEVLGRRTSFTNNTSLHDITDINPSSVSFPTVTTADALEVVSTNANDTNNAGTGVRTVRVIYIDSSNNLTTSDINLNGTTPVPSGISANEIILMESINTGSNTVSVGDVVLRKVTGAVQLEIIKSGGNKSMSAKFMIPAGYKGYLIGGDFSAPSQSQDFRLRATVKTFDRTLNSGYLFQHNYFLANGQNTGEVLFRFLQFPALSRIKVSSISGATGGNPRADCSFSILIIQD